MIWSIAPASDRMREFAVEDDVIFIRQGRI
jgi:hypothetical protein